MGELQITLIFCMAADKDFENCLPVEMQINFINEDIYKI